MADTNHIHNYYPAPAALQNFIAAARTLQGLPVSIIIDCSRYLTRLYCRCPTHIATRLRYTPWCTITITTLWPGICRHGGVLLAVWFSDAAPWTWGILVLVLGCHWLLACPNRGLLILTPRGLRRGHILWRTVHRLLCRGAPRLLNTVPLVGCWRHYRLQLCGSRRHISRGLSPVFRRGIPLPDLQWRF